MAWRRLQRHEHLAELRVDRRWWLATKRVAVACVAVALVAVVAAGLLWWLA